MERRPDTQHARRNTDGHVDREKHPDGQKRGTAERRGDRQRDRDTPTRRHTAGGRRGDRQKERQKQRQRVRPRIREKTGERGKTRQRRWTSDSGSARQDGEPGELWERGAANRAAADSEGTVSAKCSGQAAAPGPRLPGEGGSCGRCCCPCLWGQPSRERLCS